MNSILQPWQSIFAGWVNRQQQEAIEYLRTENQVLRDKLGKKRILLNDDQRRRLGVKGSRTTSLEDRAVAQQYALDDTGGHVQTLSSTTAYLREMHTMDSRTTDRKGPSTHDRAHATFF